MKKTVIILMVVSIISILSSCESKDEFLTKQPLSSFGENQVWTDPALVQTFVNNIYRETFSFPLAVKMLAVFTDEAQLAWGWGVMEFNKSLITPDTYQGWTSMGAGYTQRFVWDVLYKNIRNTNLVFANSGRIISDDATISTFKGEAYFLRALNYFTLTNVYGGVPIINKVYGLTGEFNVTRNTYEECINYISGQLDSAYMYLPQTVSSKDKINKGAALALKSRVLIYAASDLHNPEKNSLITTGYSNPELLGYTTASSVTRWTAAKDAAKAVIDLNMYDLYKAVPAATDSIAQNFVDLFLAKSTQEDILLLSLSTKQVEGGWANQPGLTVGPNGYHNWGADAPLGDLVDDYEMRDGTKFNWANLVHKANPYSKRDQRLYATVLYEGVQYRVRPSDVLALDPYSKIQVGYVYNASGTMIKAGLDTRNSVIEDWNGSYTGYYLRKFIDPTNLEPQYVNQNSTYRLIRYAEVLLNYAEACIELGEYAEARTYINKVRTRAGQPDISASVTGDALKLVCQHERRIELAFEGHRFWDVRRWLIADQAQKQTKSVDVRYITSETTVASYRKPDGTTWGNPVFSSKNTPADARVWDNKQYFFPILRVEMNKNSSLVQNPGYN